MGIWIPDIPLSESSEHQIFAILAFKWPPIWKLDQKRPKMFKNFLNSMWILVQFLDSFGLNMTKSALKIQTGIWMLEIFDYLIKKSFEAPKMSERQLLSPSKTQSKRLKGKDTHKWAEKLYCGSIVDSPALKYTPIIKNCYIELSSSFYQC